MLLRQFIALFSLGAALFAGRLVAQTPLVINGVADRSYYTATAAFSVATNAGFTYAVTLDGVPAAAGVSVAVNQPDYHELLVQRIETATSLVTNRLVRFIIRASGRGSTESGIPAWTPYPLIMSSSNEFSGARLRLIAPQEFPVGYEIPVVAWAENAQGHAVRANGMLVADGHPALEIKRGVGSGFLRSTNPAGPLNYAPHVPGLNTNKTITLQGATTWTPVSGILGATVNWPANSRIHVTTNLTVPAGGTLTIGAGTIIRINSRVDITNNGSVVINGTVDQPVVFMPNARTQPWGGFISKTMNAGTITGTGVIFTGSGAVPGWFPTSNPAGGTIDSHRKEQCLFFCLGGQQINLTDSAAIYLAGQLGHTFSSANVSPIMLTRFLMQRTTTGGEFTGANFTVNDSAFIECPDDSDNFVDGDNDGLYLVSGTHTFTNTLIGWTKDDGIDSGGSSAGTFTYQNCWFESTFHEGNSLSGTGKQVNHNESVFLGCGQGLEDGYEGPNGRLNHCLCTGNLTGARFGDNYDNYPYTGTLTATNSLLLYNYRDVWGKNWSDWNYRTSAMNIQSNFFSAPNTNHLNNELWNPLTDGWRLAAFMTAPADGPVGAGLAIRTNQFGLAQISNTVPVRLSTFTTNFVTVDYTVDSPGATLASGTLTFAPGETVKFITPTVAQPENFQLLRVALHNPAGGELTGISRAYYFPASTPTLVAKGSQWKYDDTATGQSGSAWRTVGFNDAGWSNGVAQLGFGDSPVDEATMIRRVAGGLTNITFYFRQRFVVAEPAAFASLNLWLLRDDGGVVYLNTNEVFRSSNMGAGAITYTNLTLGASAENAIDTTNLPSSLLVVGTNIVAVEIHQQALNSSDASFDFELTGVAATALELHATRFGGELALYWGDGGAVLFCADNLNGPWNPVGATSPATILLTGPQKFFRLRTP